jgi:hypothetical protein
MVRSSQSNQSIGKRFLKNKIKKIKKEINMSIVNGVTCEDPIDETPTRPLWKMQAQKQPQPQVQGLGSLPLILGGPES